MCSQKLKVYELHPAGRLTVWLSVSVCVVPYPSSHASQVPEWAGSPWPPHWPITPELTDQTALPDSKPGLPSFCPGLGQPPPDGLIVQVNDVLPEALVLSVAVAVTLNVPAALGVPEIRPDEELMDSPAGSPVAL